MNQATSGAAEGARRHVVSVLLENESGALSRVAGLFSARAATTSSR